MDNAIDKSASQFILPTDSLCNVSDFNLQTVNTNSTTNATERASFWLYNHNFENNPARRSTNINSCCDLQSRKQFQNLTVKNRTYLDDLFKKIDWDLQREVEDCYSKPIKLLNEDQQREVEESLPDVLKFDYKDFKDHQREFEESFIKPFKIEK